MPTKVILNHTCELPVISYHTAPYLYFNKDMLEDYYFITQTLPYGLINGCSDAGAYIIPIHKTKAEESDYTQHIYYEYMEKLKPYQINKDYKIRFYCVKCDRLAKIIKNEWKRPKNATECWSCFHGKK